MTTQLLRRQGALILILLLALAAGAWALLARQASMAGAMSGPTMEVGPVVFLWLWVVMMVAMMFPAAAPMILVFASVAAGRRARGAAFVPTWVFVAGYMLVWVASGAAAYALALGARELAAASVWVAASAGRVGGAVILLAGVYQLSPLKDVCLTRCRSPLSFITSCWREGYGGALWMGARHGLDCLGCCWLLFALLFPLGMMNVAAMAAIMLLIVAEKALPIGPRLGRVVGVLLIAGGLLVVARPGLLPTTM